MWQSFRWLVFKIVVKFSLVYEMHYQYFPKVMACLGIVTGIIVLIMTWTYPEERNPLVQRTMQNGKSVLNFKKSSESLLQNYRL